MPAMSVAEVVACANCAHRVVAEADGSCPSCGGPVATRIERASAAESEPAAAATIERGYEAFFLCLAHPWRTLPRISQRRCFPLAWVAWAFVGCHLFFLIFPLRWYRLSGIEQPLLQRAALVGALLVVLALLGLFFRIALLAFGRRCTWRGATNRLGIVLAPPAIVALIFELYTLTLPSADFSVLRSMLATGEAVPTWLTVLLSIEALAGVSAVVLLVYAFAKLPRVGGGLKAEG